MMSGRLNFVSGLFLALGRIHPAGVIAEENAGTLKVGKINVDEQMELAMRFQVSSIPMLVVFKDGKAVAKSVGYRPKAEIAAMVENAK